MSTQDKIEAKINLFIDLPDVIRQVAFDLNLDNYLLDGNEDRAFMALASKLLEAVNPNLHLQENLEDTPLKKLHTTCVTLLILFYPIEEVLSLIDNPDYEPKPYKPIISPQDKIVSAIARQMLISTCGTICFDNLSHIPDLRSLLYKSTLGKLGLSGLTSKESAHKGPAKRKVNNKPREAWLIKWALELDKSSNGRLSITELSKSMHRKEDEWRKEECAKLSADRIYKIIKKAVRLKRTLATRA